MPSKIPGVVLPLASLATQAPRVDLDKHALDTIADLALRIAHHSASPSQLGVDLRPYVDRSELERARMRSGVLRVIQALVLLGWIDLPS